MEGNHHCKKAYLYDFLLEHGNPPSMIPTKFIELYYRTEHT